MHERERKIGRGQHAGYSLGPFDDADAVVAEAFGKPCGLPFDGIVESIKIKVIKVYARKRVMFNQSEGRAFDRAAPTQCPQRAANERRLAGAQLARDRDDHATAHRARDRCARSRRRRCVGKFEFQSHRGDDTRSGRNKIAAKRGAASFDRLARMTSPSTLQPTPVDTTRDWAALARQIAAWGRELGFQEIGIADTDLSAEEAKLVEWLAAGRHGAMDYMARHGVTRARPGALVPGTIRVISARHDYWPAAARDAAETLADPHAAYVSRYALGRDYHKVLRRRLQQLVDRIAAFAGEFRHRIFTDSAPVLEVALAAKSGLGWRGKHTLLLHRQAGSYFFLGEIYTDLPLPVTPPATAHCGTCSACLAACPTGAIVAPYELDARRCISYLTIELPGSIPLEFRRAIGNRVYGCDDCQLACPWNKHAQPATEADFASVRNGLDRASLVGLFAWSEAEFDKRMEGSAIRRIGHERWLRNLAVGLGNAPYGETVVAALSARADDPSPLVREHVAWALAEQQRKREHMRRESS